jgi:hypothetical protein
MLLSLLSCALLLMACAAPEPRLVVQSRVERLEIPPVLLTCLESPDPPAGDMQREVAEFMIRLWDAGEDCRAKLAAIERLVDKQP